MAYCEIIQASRSCLKRQTHIHKFDQRHQCLHIMGRRNGKESACSVGDLSLIPGLGRSPGGGHGNPRQYSCLENPMYRGAWQATVRGVTKSQIWLSNLAQDSTNLITIKIKPKTLRRTKDNTEVLQYNVHNVWI